MTRKLYDENSYTARFSARVLSCERVKNHFAVVLDATGFFPEGGGQAPDTGLLGGVQVTDVQETDGVIVHTCSSPLPVGETVEGEIHWPQRLHRMQQHSGEHILSGIVHAMTGFQNVGFHMGADCTTVDFSGRLSDETIAAIMAKANAVVRQNVAIRAWYPTLEELESLTFRSKKEINGPLRLVEIPGTDLCACCAPHVARTGQCGPIVILGRTVIHGGTRLQLLCGEAAMEHCTAVLAENRGISALLSAKPLETCSAVRRTLEEVEQLKLKLSQTTKDLYAALAETHRGRGNVLLFRESGDAGKLACAVAETCGGKCAVFLPTESGFRCAVAEKDGDLQTFGKTLFAALDGRGGGRGGLIQGSVTASRGEIELFFGRTI